MSVSLEMVKMLLSLVKKKNDYTQKIIRKEQENNCAEAITNHDREVYYKGPTAYECFEKFKSENFDCQTILKKEPELLKRLPFINSEILLRMIQKHRTHYNYTDLNEIFIQSTAAIILASCSNTELSSSCFINPSIYKAQRVSKTKAFEALANTWLEFLLICNCQPFPINWAPKEDLQKLEVHMQDISYYSAYRNLLFINYTCQLYYKVSYDFTSRVLKSLNKNIPVEEFSIHAKNLGAILKIIPEALANFVWFEDEFHKVVARLFCPERVLREEQGISFLNNNFAKLSTISEQCLKTNTQEENIAQEELSDIETALEVDGSEVNENSFRMY